MCVYWVSIDMIWNQNDNESKSLQNRTINETKIETIERKNAQFVETMSYKSNGEINVSVHQ